MTSPLVGQPEHRSSSLVRFGVILRGDDDALALEVDGALQSARWLQDYTPTLGDKVAFVVTRDALGQSSNLVVGRVGEVGAIRPDEGTVTAVGSGSATVTAGGVSFTVKTTGAAPVVGDLLLLEHRQAAIYSLGKVTATTPPVPVIPQTPLPPPADPSAGVTRFSATDSRTAEAYGAWSVKDGKNVIQGTYAGLSYAGSWFYGTGLALMTGRTLTDFRVYLPARLRIGAFDAPATFDLYVTNEARAGDTDPNRIYGPFAVTLAGGWPGGWVTPPLAFAASMISVGGGLGIVDGPYAGFVGRDVDPMSGACEFTWTS